MAWIGTITNVGRELLNAWVGEAQLAFESAQAGQGLVDDSQLAAQTSLTNKRQNGGIVGKEAAEGGIRLKLRLTAAEEAYEMTQIGVLASVDSGEPVLLALFQQREGVPIPSLEESPDFAYTFYALISCSNIGNWTVHIDTSALATLEDVQKEAAQIKQDYIPNAQKAAPGGVAALDEDGLVPVEQIPLIPIDKGGTGSDNAAQALVNLGAAFQADLNALETSAAENINLLSSELNNALTELSEEIDGLGNQFEEIMGDELSPLSARMAEAEGKIATLWDAVFSNITGNPFSVAFSSLAGVKVTGGVYNKAQKRLEC